MRLSVEDEILKVCNVNAALLLEHIRFSCTGHAKKRERKFKHEGRYWCYNTQKELAEKFHLNDRNAIRIAIRHLQEAELIHTGNYNEKKYDRTLWFTVTQKAVELYLKSISDFNYSDTLLVVTKQEREKIIKNTAKPMVENNQGSVENNQPIPYEVAYVCRKKEDAYIQKLKNYFVSALPKKWYEYEDFEVDNTINSLVDLNITPGLIRSSIEFVACNVDCDEINDICGLVERTAINNYQARLQLREEVRNCG